MSVCDVCNGQGDYPIYDNHGSVRMMIECPECFGSGEPDEGLDLNVEADPTAPPASTATSIATMDELRAFVAKHNSRLPAPPAVAKEGT